MAVLAMLLIYPLIFVITILLQVMAFKKRDGILWIMLYVVEVLSIVISYVLMNYYDSLPGIGMFPGLTYITEVLFSFIAVCVYGCCLIISILTGSIYLLIRHKKQKA